jgi:hypothetical protein
MTTDFALRNTEFSGEFARFVSFVGGDDLHEAVSRVFAKLQGLPASLRGLYDERYFFHIYCADIADGPRAFQLDPSDPKAVRVASLIAGINRMKDSLSASAVPRFRSAIVGLLRPDRDIRHLEHEVRAFVHLGQKKVAVTLADLEQRGRFDMSCSINGQTFEVECKTVTEDTGEQIKTELLVTLSATFIKTLKGASNLPGSGIFTVNFSRSPNVCKDLPATLASALNSASRSLNTGDFDLKFERRPEWGTVTSSETVRYDLEAISAKYIALKFGDAVLGMALRPHKASTLSEKIISTLKAAADQCSGEHPSLLWLHLIGHREEDFLELARFSQKGDGAGLNTIVATVLHPRASSTDRSHVYKIRFSAEPKGTIQRAIIDTDRMIRKANSLSGPCYDVPNPLCRFKINIDAV